MKWGEVAPDGRVSMGYRREKRKDGTVYEYVRWSSQEAFERRRLRTNSRNSFRMRRRRHWLTKYKLYKGCERCGYNEHGCALHFDHIDPSKKKKQVSTIIKSTIKNLILEVRKCRVLCANCHAVKTHEDRQIARGQHEHFDV
tara:strand:+ start:63 stop:488 length:426 start_codon:yes stop_codon:yes gene_type:complete